MFSVEVIDKQYIGKNKILLKFNKPKGFEYAPGDYVFFEAKTKENEKIIRAYSIASFTHEDFLLFYITLVPAGKMSQVLQRLVVGDTINISEARQASYVDKIKKAVSDYKVTQIVLAAAGTGVAPFCPLVAWIREEYKDFPVVVLHQTSYSNEQVFRKDIEKHANYVGFVTRETDISGSKLRKGRIQDALSEFVNSRTYFLAVGPFDWVSSILDKARGIGAATI